MRFSELNLQTQRTAPSGIRTEGFAFLYRAGYITRDGDLLPLGQRTMARLQARWRALADADGHGATGDLLHALGLEPLPSQETEVIFAASPAGKEELLACPACGYAAERALARFNKLAFDQESPRAVEKVATPHCSTIAALADYLGLPQEKTAKALMYTRVHDGQFVFLVVRGDMQASEAKLTARLGELRLATPEEVRLAGAVPGYASPIGLRHALIVVDDLVARSPNLAAGANEEGLHLLNVNCGRDFFPDLVLDVTLARQGDACPRCSSGLTLVQADPLARAAQADLAGIFHALAERFHDAQGLTLPRELAPFEVHLLQLPGRQLDTLAAAAALQDELEGHGFSVLFDDRDERAGVKFNDADLIGCPLRLTVGEKGLQDGMVELKPRRGGSGNLPVPLATVVESIRQVLPPQSPPRQVDQIR